VLSLSLRGELEHDEDLRTVGMWGVCGVCGDVDCGDSSRTAGSDVLVFVGVCVAGLIFVLGVLGLNVPVPVPGAALFNNRAHVTTFVWRSPARTKFLPFVLGKSCFCLCNFGRRLTIGLKKVTSHVT